MHYVYGFPLEAPEPACVDILNGKYASLGYAPLVVNKPPGETFGYSGGGFIALQYLLETLSGTDIDTLSRPYLDRFEMSDFTFNLKNQAGREYAVGYFDDGTEVPGTRLMFPPLAAGGLGSAHSLATFWKHLVHAYNTPGCKTPLSHTTARLMLAESHNKGSVKFMNAEMGLGVFVMRCGPNRVACHQAANEGFRGVFLVCFEGPDAGKGFVVLTNGDNKSVITISEVLQQLLRRCGWQGLNLDALKDREGFSWAGIPQEQIVNIAFKEIVFGAFSA
jgi:CubicO group peptidase (beta-lactamase class C family)